MISVLMEIYDLMANKDMKPNTKLNTQFQIVNAKEEETNRNRLLRWGQGSQGRLG